MWLIGIFYCSFTFVEKMPFALFIHQVQRERVFAFFDAEHSRAGREARFYKFDRRLHLFGNFCRFNAMTVAEDRAGEMLRDYTMEFHRSKRAEGDRRLREVLVGIKKKRRERSNA